MAEMVHTIPINWLAHLLRTSGTHCALILVKPQTALLERQPAVIEQPAYFAFGVVDHLFVEHAMDPTRQHGIEVR